MSGTLVLVRHGQSEWNLKNLFTGWRDVDLTELGREEAKTGGEKLKARGLKFDIAFTSALKRAQKTNDIILDALGQSESEDHPRPGAERARLWRPLRPQQGRCPQEMGRGAGAYLAPLLRRPPPGGESLKDTGARVWPYYCTTCSRMCCAAKRCWSPRTAIRCAR